MEEELDEAFGGELLLFLSHAMEELLAGVGRHDLILAAFHYEGERGWAARRKASPYIAITCGEGPCEIVRILD